MFKLFGGVWTWNTSRPIYCEFCGKQEIPIPNSDGATVACTCDGAERAAAIVRSRRAKRMMGGR